MEQIEIIKDYCRYCIDLNLDYKHTKSKNQYISNFVLNRIKMYGLIGTSETRQFLENTLKYNNLIIKNEMGKIKEG